MVNGRPDRPGDVPGSVPGNVPGNVTGSTNPFDFDDQPYEVERSVPSARRTARPADAFDPFDLDRGSQTDAPVRVGQRLSWTALIMNVVGAILIAVGVGAALGSIDLQAPAPFHAVLWWGTLALLGFLIIFAGTVVAVVATVQASPRTVAVIALITGVIIGWVAAGVGYRIGAHQLTVEVVRTVGTSGPDAVPAIEHYLRERGVDAARYLGLLRRVFGG